MLKNMLYGISLLSLIACLAGCEQIETYHHIFIYDGDEVDGEITNDPITPVEPEPPKDGGDATPPVTPDDKDSEMPDNPGVMVDPDSDDPGTTEETITTENPDVMEDPE